jgi:trans-aconitate methyltransferase
MLAVARARVQAPNVRFIEADAPTYLFTPDRDLIFSRFGIMFFAEPVAAFAKYPQGRFS